MPWFMGFTRDADLLAMNILSTFRYGIVLNCSQCWGKMLDLFHFIIFMAHKISLNCLNILTKNDYSFQKTRTTSLVDM